MEFAGIDPGLNGSICFLDDMGQIRQLHKMPIMAKEIDIRGFHDILLQNIGSRNVTVYLERSQAFPGMAASAQFSVGRTFGLSEAILVLLKVPYVLVPPAVWTKYLHKGVKSTLKAKEKSLIIAERLYPGIREICTSPRGKLHDGLIDALLIARYGFEKQKTL